MKWFAGIGRRESELPDFAGKVIVVHTSSGHGEGVFEDARLVRIGFSHFVVGRKVEVETWRGECNSSVKVWFGIYDIKQIHIYENIEEARKAYTSDGL